MYVRAHQPDNCSIKLHTHRPAWAYEMPAWAAVALGGLSGTLSARRVCVCVCVVRPPCRVRACACYASKCTSSSCRMPPTSARRATGTSAKRITRRASHMCGGGGALTYLCACARERLLNWGVHCAVHLCKHTAHKHTHTNIHASVRARERLACVCRHRCRQVKRNGAISHHSRMHAMMRRAHLCARGICARARAHLCVIVTHWSGYKVLANEHVRTHSRRVACHYVACIYNNNTRTV